MGDISTWNPVDESNTMAPPNGWPENQATNTVNNCARAMMGGVRRWYDTVTAQIASINTSLGTFMPITGGLFTGGVTGPGFHSNGTLSASTNIAANGNITAGGNITASGTISGTGGIGGDTITGNHLQSNGNIDAAGDISCNDLTATGNLSAASIGSTGAITAAGAVYGGFLSSSGAASVATNLDVGGNGSIHGALGVDGNIACGSSLTVAGNISSGDINAAGVVSTPYLKSNAAHLAGTLLTWGGGNHVNFRWNGTSLAYRIDEATEIPVTTAEGDIVEHTIATTEVVEELRQMLSEVEARLAALEGSRRLEPA
jgi:hypothetical protein